MFQSTTAKKERTSNLKIRLCQQIEQSLLFEMLLAPYQCNFQQPRRQKVQILAHLSLLIAQLSKADNSITWVRVD
ncbi:MAG: hypothetical protein ABI076_06340, partial [Acidobacteriaceae bacterium]